VPRGMKDLDDSYAWFMADRRWFFAIFLLGNAMDVIDSFTKSTAWALRPTFMVWEAAILVGSIVGIRSENRRVQQVVAVGLFAYQLIYAWASLMVLGHW